MYEDDPFEQQYDEDTKRRMALATMGGQMPLNVMPNRAALMARRQRVAGSPRIAAPTGDRYPDTASGAGRERAEEEFGAKLRMQQGMFESGVAAPLSAAEESQYAQNQPEFAAGKRGMDAALQSRRALMNRNRTAMEDMAGMKREGPDNIVNNAMQRRAELAAQMHPQAARFRQMMSAPMPQDEAPRGMMANPSSLPRPFKTIGDGVVKTEGGQNMNRKRQDDEKLMADKRKARLAEMNQRMTDRGMAQAAPRIALEKARAEAIGAARGGTGKAAITPPDFNDDNTLRRWAWEQGQGDPIRAQQAYEFIKGQQASAPAPRRPALSTQPATMGQNGQFQGSGYGPSF